MTNGEARFSPSDLNSIIGWYQAGRVTLRQLCDALNARLDEKAANGETRLRELVAAMEHRVKSSMSRPHRGRPAEIAGWQYYFDDSCDRCQLEQALAAPVQAKVGAGEENICTGCYNAVSRCECDKDALGSPQSSSAPPRLQEDAQSIPAARPEVGAFDLPAKWRKLAEASEDKYNHNPDCVNEDFEPLRMCADDLEAALAARPYVGAGERALAQRIIDLPCIVEVRGPDVVGQIAEQLAARPEVAGGGLRERIAVALWELRSPLALRDWNTGASWIKDYHYKQADAIVAILQKCVKSLVGRQSIKWRSARDEEIIIDIMAALSDAPPAAPRDSVLAG